MSSVLSPVVVVGAGGFAREVLDVLEAMARDAGGPTVLGVIDDGPSQVNAERLRVRDVRHLGTIAEWIASGTIARFVMGIGDPVVRARIAAELEQAGLEPASAIHPSAIIGSQFEVGVGAVVCGGVHISTNVRLGRYVHVSANATIGHDSILEECVSVNPGAIISGEVVVESGVLLGAGSVILQNLRIGAGSTVGASACVVRNVPSGVTVKGVPAR